MKSPSRLFLALLALGPAALTARTAGGSPETSPLADTAAPAAEKQHPLKGVIVGLLPEKTALLVKHEEVPGVMRAMTMMFKVDPEVLTRVKPGHAITALMSRRADGWWLTNVVVVEPSPAPVAP